MATEIGMTGLIYARKMRTLNFAQAIFAALLATGLCSCGGGGGCAAATQQRTGSEFESGDVQHILSYGQSLSLGEHAVNLWPTNLTIPAEQDVGFMFESGVIPRGSGERINSIKKFANLKSSF